MATTEEMILSAIAALGEKNGSNEPAIIEYIEATYADTLREGYTAAISETLTKLNETGELLFANKRYSKSDPNLRTYQGSGRPEEPKQTLPPEALPPTPRRRGRPPKPKGSQSNAVKAVEGAPPRRGRPPKPKGSQSNAVKAVEGPPRRRGRPPKPKGSQSNVAKAVEGAPRRRGRPPKPKVAEKISGHRGRPPKRKESNAFAAKAVGRISGRRGRPPIKHQLGVSAASKAVAKGVGTAPAASGAKRRRGRPPKVKPAVAGAAAE